MTGQEGRLANPEAHKYSPSMPTKQPEQSAAANHASNGIADDASSQKSSGDDSQSLMSSNPNSDKESIVSPDTKFKLSITSLDFMETPLPRAQPQVASTPLPRAQPQVASTTLSRAQPQVASTPPPRTQQQVALTPLPRVQPQVASQKNCSEEVGAPLPGTGSRVDHEKPAVKECWLEMTSKMQMQVNSDELLIPQPPLPRGQPLAPLAPQAPVLPVLHNNASRPSFMSDDTNQSRVPSKKDSLLVPPSSIVSSARHSPVPSMASLPSRVDTIRTGCSERSRSSAMRNDELEAALATLTQDRSKMEGNADSDSESCISTDQDGDFGSSRVGTFDFGDFPLGEGILPRCSNLGSPLDFQSPYSSRWQSRESSKQSTTREGKMGSSQEAMRKEESLGSSKELIKKAGSWIKEERGPIAHNVLPIRETSPSHSGKEANPPKTPPKKRRSFLSYLLPMAPSQNDSMQQKGSETPRLNRLLKIVKRGEKSIRSKGA